MKRGSCNRAEPPLCERSQKAHARGHFDNVIHCCRSLPPEGGGSGAKRPRGSESAVALVFLLAPESTLVAATRIQRDVGKPKG
eukprot:6094806-Amphidinium_carterae.1